jgi:hypothetical protein
VALPSWNLLFIREDLGFGPMYLEPVPPSLELVHFCCAGMFHGPYLSLSLSVLEQTAAAVEHDCNPSILEAEAGGS